MKDAAYQTAVGLGLVKFSEPVAFLNRNKPGGRSFIVDSRGSGTNPALRALLIEALEGALEALPPFDMLAGVAHSGTPWAATLAYKLNVPFCNILQVPRKSGMQRQIEGDVQGKRVVLMDNWVNTGASVIHAAKVAREHGGEPAGILAIAGECAPALLDLPLVYALQTDKLITAAIDQELIPVSLLSTFFNNKI